MQEYYIAEIVSLVFMAAALGMDAFSVCLGIGMQRLRLKRIALIGLTIGVMHVIMPFLGIILGSFLSGQIGQLTTLAGGLLLFGIGAQMVFSAFSEGPSTPLQPIGFGLLLLAFSVSIDSFSVGLSLGLSGVKTMLALLLFGAFSMMLAWSGMLLGRKVQGLLGIYSEILGGSVLCGFGLHVLFG
ncbi:manganese efflux pump MntP family protein [Virgibacillus xinjiangensis]|uniref:Putative manganese efflux pump MntP n=1 Tax=Virgibacillus xinjiangensis TaxID=393090 RepID=A0ABV7CU09_9BACI